MRLSLQRILTVVLAVAAILVSGLDASAEQGPTPTPRIEPAAPVHDDGGITPLPALAPHTPLPAAPVRLDTPQPVAAPVVPPVPVAATQGARAAEAARLAEAVAAVEAVAAAATRQVEAAELAAAVAAAEAAVESVVLGIQPAELEKVAAEAQIAASRVAGTLAAVDLDIQAVVARKGDQETRIYNEARAAIDKAQWDRAIERYTQVVEMKGSRADAALYWKAFAQDRQGMRAEALTTIAALGRDYPQSRYLQQAKVLEAEIRQKAGQPVRPQDQSDDDLKLMALNALQHTAPEQAVPMLEKLLQGTASPRVKERALFVLAQSNSPQAREMLKGVAKGTSIPELQGRAITYLAQHGGAESRAVLAEVYGSTADVGVRRSILRAYMISGDRERLLSAAQSEQNPELRTEAVRQLGTMNAHAELAQLYARESAVEVKKQIIRAMFVGGNASRMIELAKTEPNPDLRREAIRNLGLMGSKGPADALVEIYGSERDAEVKRAVVHALGAQGNAPALVAIARKEQDAAMRAEVVRRLSVMGNNKVATDYMLEILGGK